MRLEEIEKRLSLIKTEELDKEGADLDILEKEVSDLKEERKSILEKVEKRKSLLEGIANMESPKVIQKFDEEKGEKRVMENIVGKVEYREGFLKKLQGRELNEVEERAMLTTEASVGSVIPEVTQNKILEVVKQYAPLLNEIELLQVPGGVTIPVENVVAEATKHAEGATITASNDTITNVTLFGYEITKLLTISKSVKQMSIGAFETWLVNNLGRALAEKITANIINGTGTGEAKGINTLTWDATNSVTVAKASELASKNVNALIGLLPGAYDKGAKFLMSKKTLFQDFMNLQDNAKHDLVKVEGGKYYIQGYEVLLDDRIALNEAILGNFYEGYKGNMPENINITSAFDIKTNSYDYLGAAMFDGKPALPNAFVKLVKATA